MFLERDMKLNIDEQLIDLPCPQCGHKLSESIGRLKHSPELTCVCGCLVKVEASDLAAGIEDVEKRLDEFSRSITRILK